MFRHENIFVGLIVAIPVLFFFGMYCVVNGFPDLNPFGEDNYAPACNLDLMKTGDMAYINGERYILLGITEYGNRGEIELLKVEE